MTVLSRIKAAAGVGVLAGALLLIRALRAGSGWAVAGKRERAQLAVVCSGLFGLSWWLVIAVVTQAGFSGNNRYLVLGAALIEIAGGVGLGMGGGRAAQAGAPRARPGRALVRDAGRHVARRWRSRRSRSCSSLASSATA